MAEDIMSFDYSPSDLEEVIPVPHLNLEGIVEEKCFQPKDGNDYWIFACINNVLGRINRFSTVAITHRRCVAQIYTVSHLNYTERLHRKSRLILLFFYFRLYNTYRV